MVFDMNAAMEMNADIQYTHTYMYTCTDIHKIYTSRSKLPCRRKIYIYIITKINIYR